MYESLILSIQGMSVWMVMAWVLLMFIGAALVFLFTAVILSEIQEYLENREMRLSRKNHPMFRVHENT